MGLRLIYTPNAHDFCLTDREMFDHGIVPRTLDIGKNYELLRNDLGSLPDQIGVITFSPILKSSYSRSRIVHAGETVYYAPLGLYRNLIEEMERDVDNPLGVKHSEMVISKIILHPYFVSLDGTHRLRHAFAPSIHHLKLTLREVQQAMSASTLVAEKWANAELELKKLTDMNQIYVAYERVVNWFKLHGIDEAYPLTFVPPNLHIPDLYVVDTKQAKVLPDHLNELPKILSVVDPTEVQSLISEFEIETQGRTDHRETLDELLDSLPEPKIILTDTYPVDLFPDLHAKSFSTTSFDPAKHL